MNADAKKIVTITAFSAFFIFIIVYAVFRSSDLILGVKIKNVDITDGETVTNSILQVTGVAKNAISLTLDGRQISVDQTGNFSETIALLPGYNIVSLKAVDKFGNNDEKDYKLTYQAPENGAQ